jgi:hypothetical protein
MNNVLTRDNLPLSRLTMADQPTPVTLVSAINCTSPAPSTVADYIRESLAENMRIAYLSDLTHFEKWGGQIPATPETIAEYLVAHRILSVATLNRRLAALAKFHRSRGFSNPASVEVVKATLRGLKRIKGTAQHQATPLSSRKTCLWCWKPWDRGSRMSGIEHCCC